MLQKQLMFIALTVGIVNPISAALKPLEAALNSGKVCEKTDGFIQPTPGNESETATLVESINAERAQVYAEIAKNQGTDPVTVGHLNGKEMRAQNPKWACN